MATALKPEVPVADETLLIEAAMRARQAVTAERVRAMSRWGVDRGTEVRVEALLTELSTHIATVAGCAVEEAREHWCALVANTITPLTFLEDAAIAVRVDQIHQVLTRV